MYLLVETEGKALEPKADGDEGCMYLQSYAHEGQIVVLQNTVLCRCLCSAYVYVQVCVFVSSEVLDLSSLFTIQWTNQSMPWSTEGLPPWLISNLHILILSCSHFHRLHKTHFVVCWNQIQSTSTTLDWLCLMERWLCYIQNQDRQQEIIWGKTEPRACH